MKILEERPVYGYIDIDDIAELIIPQNEAGERIIRALDAAARKIEAHEQSEHGAPGR